MTINHSDLNGWQNYFQEVERLVVESERLCGMANCSYADYIIERLDMYISTCSNLLHIIQQNVQLQDEHKESLQELIDCLRLLHQKWNEYEGILDSYPASTFYSLSYQKA